MSGHPTPPRSDRLTVRRFLKPRRQQDRLDDPIGVQLTEQLFDYPVTDPTVESPVNHMLATVFLRQPPPLAVVFVYVQQCVYEGDVLKSHPKAAETAYSHPDSNFANLASSPGDIVPGRITGCD